MSKNPNLEDSGISLPVLPSRTNLKLHNTSKTPKLVKKVITNLDSSKASGPDCIPVVVLKNCEPELSYILAELFNKCLKESCFPNCWKVSSVVPVFKNVGERSTVKNYHPVSLLSVVRMILLPNFWKGGGSLTDLNFERGLLGKRGAFFWGRGLQFLNLNINNLNFINKNVFLCHN